MNRRKFLGAVSGVSVAGAAWLEAQAGPPVNDPVEKDTPAKSPTIALNHLGFRPHTGRKVLVVRVTANESPREFSLRDVVPPFHFTRPLTLHNGDLGPCFTADFTDLDRSGIYQISVGNERSGVDVPGVHSICHLDDARRRDNGEHVNVIGGWHDAGDLRKWMDPTMLNAIALLNLVRNIPDPQPGDPTHEQILDEVRHGNRYFLKMQDADGRVWHDAAGGVNGDNSDNHWTDNIVGT